MARSIAFLMTVALAALPSMPAPRATDDVASTACEHTHAHGKTAKSLTRKSGDRRRKRNEDDDEMNNFVLSDLGGVPFENTPSVPKLVTTPYGHQYREQPKGGPCLASDSKLNTWSEAGMPEHIKIKDAKRGDYVRIDGEKFDEKVGKVDVVVCQSGSFEVIPFAKADGAITPWHPILADGTWTFPEKTYEMQVFGSKKAVPEICNIMLVKEGQRQHSRFTIDTVTVAAMGHDLTDNDVIKHDFFGSHAIISAALSKAAKSQYDNGRVNIQGVTRGDDGLIDGFGM